MGLQDCSTEQNFIKHFIVPGFKNNHGYSISDVAGICAKAESYSCLVIGIESNIDFDNLFTEVFETYGEEYQREWWFRGLHYFQLEGIVEHIHVFIDVPDEILKQHS